MGKDQTSRRKRDIPAYTFVPSVDFQDRETCSSSSSSAGSWSSLEGTRVAGDGKVGRWEDSQQDATTAIRADTKSRRTNSLPIMLSACQQAVELNSSSGAEWFSKHSNSSSTSLTDMATTSVPLKRQSSNDRPPKVPRRRGSLQTSSSSRLFVVPYPRAQAAVRGAWAA